MSADRMLLTKDEALYLLKDGEEIHRFMQAGPILCGADVARSSIVKDIESAESVEVAGATAREMGHGLAIKTRGTYSFVEHNEDKLKQLEAEATNKGEQTND